MVVLLPALLMLEALLRIPTPAPIQAPAVQESTEPASPTAAVTGQVVDAIKDTPISQAVVALPELRMEVSTDDEGRFVLTGVSARERPYELLVTCAGYGSITLMATVKVTDEKLQLDPVKLRPLGW